jgi:hypothetical protein
MGAGAADARDSIEAAKSREEGASKLADHDEGDIRIFEG